jgi:capsular exopolysaccharide synthesis family protein
MIVAIVPIRARVKRLNSPCDQLLSSLHARGGRRRLALTDVLNFEPGLADGLAFDRARTRGSARASPLLGMLDRAGARSGAAAESIRSIRAGLMAAGFAHGGAFALVAPRAGQGASVLAANLAMAFAQLELSTLLVDANLRRPGLCALFGLPARREGLAECLTRRDAQAPIAREVAPNLAVLPAGAAPPNPQELIASKLFAGMATSWAREFDLVIYDAPGALDCADACLIAARAGSAVIAARLDAARFDEVRQVGAALRAHGCSIAGVVGASFA